MAESVSDIIRQEVTGPLALLPRPRAILVGVSGGPDSTCLLHALRCGIGPQDTLVAGHVDHQMRLDSHHDLVSIRRLCEMLDVPLEVRGVDAPAHAQREKLSLETAARNVRYGALREMAAARGARYLAIGHTADDQAETVLMHALRGAGIMGLAGMAPLQGDVFRPLLRVTREQVEEYCRENTLPVVCDPSNTDLVFTRNRVRHELLPLIEAIYPGARAALGRLAASARRDGDYLAALTEEALEVCEVRPPNAALVNALPEALRYHFVRALLRRGSPADMDTHAIERVLGSLEEDIACSDGDDAGSVGGSKSIEETARHCHAYSSASLEIPGRIRVFGGELSAVIMPVDPMMRLAVLISRPWQAYLDADKLGNRVHVRSRRPGDRMRPLGAPGSRKVQDVLVDKKIASCYRDAIPIVEADGRIIWIIGVTVGHDVRVTDETRRVVVLRFRREITDAG